MGRRATLKHGPAVVLAYKQEQAQQDIKNITAWLKDPRIELYQRTIKTGKLMLQSYKIIGDTREMCQTARELIELVKGQSYKIPLFQALLYRDPLFIFWTKITFNKFFDFGSRR